MGGEAGIGASCDGATIFGITTPSIMAVYCYAECHLCLQSVANKPFMLSVVMLNVVILNVLSHLSNGSFTLAKSVREKVQIS